MTLTPTDKLDYPKTLKENLQFRAWVLDQCAEDEKMAAAIKLRCSQDILFFFNVILWTYDPRTQLKTIPFITYEFQDKYIQDVLLDYRAQIDGLTEKSRDMGASWMLLGIIFWLWLFEPGFNALVGSYIEDMVDDTTIESHFGRFEYFLNHLPSFLLPNQLKRSSMNLSNPENRSAIVGAAPTAKFSRGGRYSLVLADEFAFWNHARAAWTAMGDATKCRIVTSTTNGKGNKFADLALKSPIKKYTLHWKLHPLKTNEWYEKEKLRRTEEEVAQELDINYNKSVTGRVYPEFEEYNFLQKQEYNPLLPLYVSWDFGLNDPTALIWLQCNPKTGEVFIIDAYQKSGHSIDFFVPFVTGEVKSFKEYKYDDDELAMIEKHSHWQPAIHYGDPTGDNSHQSSKTSVVKQLKEYGIIVVSKRGADFEIDNRIRATKLLIRRLKVDKDLLDFIDAIQNAHYPRRADLSQATTGLEKPVHDWTSHYRTALEFYAINENLKKVTLGGIVKQAAQRIISVNPLQSYVDQQEKRMQNRKSPGYRRSV